MGQCMPSKDETVKLLKQLFSSGLGMCAALALNSALKKSFEDISEDAGPPMYAVLISWISIMILGVIKIYIKNRAERWGGERAAAICDLFKICFCLLSASAWQALVQTSDDEWVIFGIAMALTVGLVILIIIVFEAYDAYKNRYHSRCHPAPGCFCMMHMVGLVQWTPITFGLVTGVVWNEFFSTLIRDELGGEDDSRATLTAVAFLYAFITVPVAITIILYTHRVEQKGWGCCSLQCPGRCGTPCCGMRNEVTEALVAMFTGEASALMAFAWNDAFLALYSQATDEPTTNPDGTAGGMQSKDGKPKMGFIILYVCLALLFSVFGILVVKRCTKKG